MFYGVLKGMVLYLQKVSNKAHIVCYSELCFRFTFSKICIFLLPLGPGFTC